jgi:hypothetical protein
VTATAFKLLTTGRTFRFADELRLGFQGARGPWIKLSPRRYAPEDMSTEHRVGSVNAAVVEVAPKEGGRS